MIVSPRAYARARRIWKGSIPVSKFKRLATEFDDDDAITEIDVSFSFDEWQRVRIEGTVLIQGRIPCKQCMKPLVGQVTSTIDAVIVDDERHSKELLKETDVIVCEDGPVSLVDLLEDDLILSMPWKACDVGKNCRDLSHLSDSRARTEAKMQRPFSELKDLLS